MIGVAEVAGQPVLPPAGLLPEQIDSIQKKLLNLGNSAMQPPYHPLSAVYEIQGKSILVLWAPGGETERELLSLAATVPFDDRYRQTAALEDLSSTLYVTIYTR